MEISGAIRSSYFPAVPNRRRILMNTINIPVGTSNFAEIRRKGSYFIDKSGLIEQLLKTQNTKVTLITRPRRFGKTLGMSMLSEFFDIQKSSAALFDGLSVVKNEELCRHWMNQYPTLFLSFRSVDGLNFSGAFAQLASVIAELYKRHIYLTESERILSLDKEQFHRIAAEKTDLTDIKNSLLKLTQFMELHYEKPVILIIDEYDGPRLLPGQYALKVPNKEVLGIFKKSVRAWLLETTVQKDRRELFAALWDGNAQRLTELISDLLFDTISCHDYAESFYHAFLTGLSSNAGYRVESNYENGFGRSDIVVKDRRNRRAVVLEAKRAYDEEQMESACGDALNQIREKRYAKKLERDGYKKVGRLGIAFFQKKCLVKGV